MRDCSLIDSTIKRYLENSELSCGALIVYKNRDTVYKNKWGYSDLAAKKAVAYNSIYRMMSMTKPVTAAAVMKLAEQGDISLDAPVSQYIPAFHDMSVYVNEVPLETLAALNPDRKGSESGFDPASLAPILAAIQEGHYHTAPAIREITIRDLLTHSSGLEQGVYGFVKMLLATEKRATLATVAEMYSHYPLDFQPGTATNYSPLAGFDILARIVEIIEATPFDQYLKREIFDPLKMKDSTFHLSPEQEGRLVRVYMRKNGILNDVTGTKDDMDGMIHRGPDYICASGGLYATVEDYERFARMLLNEGSLDGVQILEPETVRLMRSEGAYAHLETEPGFVWGLGMKICQEPEHGVNPCTAGTYGWSGAFGTHFFISPADRMEAVWVTNRSDLGGSGSYISREIERLVFDCFA